MGQLGNSQPCILVLFEACGQALYSRQRTGIIVYDFALRDDSSSGTADVVED